MSNVRPCNYLASVNELHVYSRVFEDTTDIYLWAILTDCFYKACSKASMQKTV